MELSRVNVIVRTDLKHFKVGKEKISQRARNKLLRKKVFHKNRHTRKINILQQLLPSNGLELGGQTV